jgi:hypothetical protein
VSPETARFGPIDRRNLIEAFPVEPGRTPRDGNRVIVVAKAGCRPGPDRDTASGFRRNEEKQTLPDARAAW